LREGKVGMGGGRDGRVGMGWRAEVGAWCVRVGGLEGW